MELHDNPRAVAAAQRIKAEKGFDPLDPEVVAMAVQRYKDTRFRQWLWSMAAVLPLFLVILGVIFAVNPGRVAQATPIGIAFIVIGSGLAWYPLRRLRRSYREWRREVLPVITAYEAVLRAGQPDPRHSGHAVIQWKRAQGLM